MQTALPVAPSEFTPTAPTCQRLPGSRRKRCAASLFPPASFSVSSSSSQRSQASMRLRSGNSGISGSTPWFSPTNRLNASLTLQDPEASARTTTSMPPGSPVSRTRTPEISTAPDCSSMAKLPSGVMRRTDGALMNCSNASLSDTPACANNPRRYWCNKDLRSSAHSLRASPRPKIFCSKGSLGGKGGNSLQPKNSSNRTWHLRNSLYRRSTAQLLPPWANWRLYTVTPPFLLSAKHCRTGRGCTAAQPAPAPGPAWSLTAPCRS
mmetsp:Transcript_75675/g.208826  ORF Transcript_75675/g.208826 Transcript_75675/m.208826 type:complete len:265 (+) Transcript_75675:159-953(+)